LKEFPLLSVLRSNRDMVMFTQGGFNVPMNQDTDLRSVLETRNNRIFFVVTKNVCFLWMFFEFKDKFTTWERVS